MTTTKIYRLDEMIKCAGRELGLRRALYPRQIRVGRITQEDADREIALMAAIYERLKLDRDRETEGR